jgi:sugar lactone lactonase YvrE
MKARLILLLGLVMGLSLAVAPAVAAHSPNGHKRLPARIDLPDGWQPEGITAGRGATFYVGSLADGAIWKGNFRTGRGKVFVPGVAGQVAVGVEYDWRNNRIWVAGGPTGAVRVYSARSGRLLRSYQFPVSTSAPVFLNDLVVTRRGVFVTDSLNQQLDVIPLGRHGRLPQPDKAFSLPLGGELKYQTGFNVNGIVARDGWLILVQSNTGQLFRVNPRTGNARAIDLGTYSVLNGDGLELHGRTLYVVRNQVNLVAVIRLNWRLTSGRVLGELTAPGRLDIPSTAAFSLGRLWAVNARFSTPPTPTTEYWITRLPARP